MSSVTEATQILISASVFSLLQYVVLVEYMKTVWPHTKVNGVGRSILVAFSDNCRYSSLSCINILKATFYRLVTVWALKLSSELFPLLHQNPLVSHELWMDLLPLHGFVKYIEHLETFSSLSYEMFPLLIHFIM